MAMALDLKLQKAQPVPRLAQCVACPFRTCKNSAVMCDQIYMPTT